MTSIIAFYSPVTDPANAQGDGVYTEVIDGHQLVGWTRFVLSADSIEDATKLAASLALTGETVLGVSALAA